ncbi:hypothetical protein FB559_6986 [Actinoallomurus bryophytorum]|uniref:Uncharacterized protein n=1 Tax=Actinoallomurus bryophytorum TaxID=1490222 RepID=A0A543CVV6_9ACTN|nr:hypothetical protein FB559_6986 [Actinoallomurus bryophytorum]
MGAFRHRTDRPWDTSRRPQPPMPRRPRRARWSDGHSGVKFALLLGGISPRNGTRRWLRQGRAPRARPLPMLTTTDLWASARRRRSDHCALGLHEVGVSTPRRQPGAHALQDRRRLRRHLGRTGGRGAAVPARASPPRTRPPGGTSASADLRNPAALKAVRARTAGVNRSVSARRGGSAEGPVTGLAGRLGGGRIGDHGLVTEGGVSPQTAKKPAFELRSRAIYRNLTHRSRPRNVRVVREGTGCREAAPTLREDFHWTPWSGPRSGSR